MRKIKFTKEWLKLGFNHYERAATELVAIIAAHDGGDVSLRLEKFFRRVTENVTLHSVTFSHAKYTRTYIVRVYFDGRYEAMTLPPIYLEKMAGGKWLTYEPQAPAIIEWLKKPFDYM